MHTCASGRARARAQGEISEEMETRRAIWDAQALPALIQARRPSHLRTSCTPHAHLRTRTSTLCHAGLVERAAASTAKEVWIK